jgi:hypothetical protein
MKKKKKKKKKQCVSGTFTDEGTFMCVSHSETLTHTHHDIGTHVQKSFSAFVLGPEAGQRAWYRVNID